jgi:hypothetical protein
MAKSVSLASYGNALRSRINDPSRCMAGSGDSAAALAIRLIAAGFDTADVHVIAGRLLLRCERRRQRFLIITKLDEAMAAPLFVLLNWASEIEK